MPDTRPDWWSRLRHWPRFFAQAETDAATLYNLRGTDAIRSGGSVPLVNMGLWDGIHPSEPDSLQRAVYALFDLVAQGADLGPADQQVLDLGCGFGTNAIHCSTQYGPAHITGINVSSVQLTTARERVREANREDRVHFLEASATKLPVEAGRETVPGGSGGSACRKGLATPCIGSGAPIPGGAFLQHLWSRRLSGESKSRRF